jgi:hypothetical protein
MGPSTGTGSLLVARFPVETLPVSETSVVIRDILSVGVVS